VILDRLLHLVAPGVVVPLGARDADDGETGGKQSSKRQRVERRQKLLVREIAGRAEDDERARVRRAPEGESFVERVRLGR
jgi:hypothetical protein